MREVRQLRLARGWNQTELAFHAGLAPSVISQIENGKRDPSAGTLRKLASALGVEVADLFPKAEAPLWQDESKRRSPSLKSWADFVGRLADRWEQEVEKREEEWDAANRNIRKNVKWLPNLSWANEIRGTAVDVATVANEELEAGLGIYTSREALQLFSALRRLDKVIDRTVPWYSSADGSLDTAKVINFRERLEQMEKRVGVRAS